MGAAARRQPGRVQERTLRSVTANARRDAEEFLRLAQQLRLRARSRRGEADRTLAGLGADRINGTAVRSL